MLLGITKIEATHIKTGHIYAVLGIAIDATNDRDGQLVVIYSREGKLFIRELEEFKRKFKTDYKFAQAVNNAKGI